MAPNIKKITALRGQTICTTSGDGVLKPNDSVAKSEHRRILQTSNSLHLQLTREGGMVASVPAADDQSKMRAVHRQNPPGRRPYRPAAKLVTGPFLKFTPGDGSSRTRVNSCRPTAGNPMNCRIVHLEYLHDGVRVQQRFQHARDPVVIAMAFHEPCQHVVPLVERCLIHFLLPDRPIRRDRVTFHCADTTCRYGCRTPSRCAPSRFASPLQNCPLTVHTRAYRTAKPQPGIRFGACLQCGRGQHSLNTVRG